MWIDFGWQQQNRDFRPDWQKAKDNIPLIGGNPVYIAGNAGGQTNSGPDDWIHFSNGTKEYHKGSIGLEEAIAKYGKNVVRVTSDADTYVYTEKGTGKQVLLKPGGDWDYIEPSTTAETKGGIKESVDEFIDNVGTPAVAISDELVKNDKSVSKGAKIRLQNVGIALSVYSAANDIVDFKNGKISGAHLTVNLIMNGVGFLGPIGAGISLLYGFTEDWWW